MSTRRTFRGNRKSLGFGALANGHSWAVWFEISRSGDAEVYKGFLAGVLPVTEVNQSRGHERCPKEAVRFVMGRLAMRSSDPGSKAIPKGDS